MSDTFEMLREKREYVRLEKAIKVQFKLSNTQPEMTYEATTKNISKGGLCIDVIDPDEELLTALRNGDGENVHIDIKLLGTEALPNPDVRRVWSKSKLKWLKEKDHVLYIGLSFDALNDDVRSQVHHYILNQFIAHYGSSDHR